MSCPECSCTEIWDLDCPDCDAEGCHECYDSGYVSGWFECSECKHQFEE